MRATLRIPRTLQSVVTIYRASLADAFAWLWATLSGTSTFAADVSGEAALGAAWSGSSTLGAGISGIAEIASTLLGNSVLSAGCPATG